MSCFSADKPSVVLLTIQALEVVGRCLEVIVFVLC